MTKIFILIIFIKEGYGGGATSMEFNSKEACESARTEITEMFSERPFGYYISKCLSKD